MVTNGWNKTFKITEINICSTDLVHNQVVIALVSIAALEEREADETQGLSVEDCTSFQQGTF